LGVPVKGSGLGDGIEVFPKHDEMCIRDRIMGGAEMNISARASSLISA